MQLLEKSTYSQNQDINANPVTHLENSTVEYLHASFLLYEYKNNHSKKEYRHLLTDFGWDKGSAEEKRALKIALHFQEFAHRPQDLKQIPITVLLRLCSDNYAIIIRLIEDFQPEHITCDCILHFINRRKEILKQEKSQQPPEPLSIWRRNRQGQRYAQFPSIHEDDHQTGILTQKLIDEHGLLPQQIIREAISDLYQKLTQEDNDTYEESAPSTEADDGVLFENSELYSNNNQSEDNCVDTFVNDKISDNNDIIDANHTEKEYESEYLEEPIESDVELQELPIDKAVQTLIYGEWQEIRDIFDQHPHLKEHAWNSLTDPQKQRVIDITPETVKILNQAKRDRIIAEYKEVGIRVYQIKLPGKILWEQRTFHEIEIPQYLEALKEKMLCSVSN